jgi:hypothetical protein
LEYDDDDDDDDDGDEGDSGGSSPSPCSLTASVFTDVLSSLACFRSSYISSTILFIFRNSSVKSSKLIIGSSPPLGEIPHFQNSILIYGLKSSSVPSPRLDLELVIIHLQIHFKPWI